MRDKCDKCGSAIIENRCDCGMWYKNNEAPPIGQLVEATILTWNRDNKRNLGVTTCDHYSGTCMAIFKGDYELCLQVKKYIKELQAKKDNS